MSVATSGIPIRYPIPAVARIIGAKTIASNPIPTAVKKDIIAALPHGLEYLPLVYR